MSDSETESIDINDVMEKCKSSDKKSKGIKKSKSITEEYIDYHDYYVEKFGKDRTLVLMQVGTFYEAYATPDKGPNLQTLEEITEACIAHKGQNKNVVDINNPWMWGFPMVASSKFIGILIDAGYRLIMIDQISPKPHPKRAVVAIHSPATYLETAYKPASNFVATICVEEIKQKNNQILACIGMSAIDVSTGEVLIHESHSQMNDDKLGLDETIRFLNSIVPKETIIYKENLQKLNDDYMIEYLELRGKFYQFRDINKEHNKLIYQKKMLEKVYPERENMTSIIDTLGLSKTIYARKSLVHLLTYVSDHYEELVKGVMDPVFYLSEQFMTLGNDAINQLNIVDNKMMTDTPGSVKFHNLLDVVNKASTGMGKRYIKMRLISPYTDVETLTDIYDTVDCLLADSWYTKIEGSLKNINDIERMYRKVTLNVLHPIQMVDMINSLNAVEELFGRIKTNKNLSEHIKVGKLIGTVKKLNQYLDKNIDCDKAKQHTLSDLKENIFKEGIYPELDNLQEKIGLGHDVMEELLDKLNDLIPDGKINNGKKIVLKHNRMDGYYYQLTSKRYTLLKKQLDSMSVIKLTKISIKVNDFDTKDISNNVKLSLPFLKKQTDDIEGLIEKIENITHKHYINFLQQIVKDYGELMKQVIDIVTKVDYFTTVAKTAKLYKYVRPQIVDVQQKIAYVEAQQIRHPIVERIIDHEYVPHDIDIGKAELKGMMIYGLNSAGKSVLMKAIGINIILAQAGFFVAAKQFKYYPYKAMYTRITGNDNLFRGLSSYSLEIVELNSILKRSNTSTLVIGDEVCRGTEHISGNAIVATTLLKLSSVGASFVFATHLHELMEIDEIKQKQNIKAFHLSVEHDEKMDRLVYDRELKPGSGERIYGITVAKYIIKDEDFIKKALEIKNILVNRDPDSAVLSTKRSRYNSDVLMDKCDMCGKREGDMKNTKGEKTNLETHHINHQKDCEDGFVKTKSHIKKNQIFNLMVLCQNCHDKIHNEDIQIQGIKMTSQGRKIIVKTKTESKGNSKSNSKDSKPIKTSKK